ncbi:MAG: neutral/alkaline non-lysosomal ceramidase N-terminal domain-containing protein [Bryobacterales bacterium]|nr:neutral/alkaline non-lysosomal ceramidase N-terminal domain-containing protein [Bryobacterales bacterium]
MQKTCLIAILAASAAFAQGWKAGAASESITPTEPVWMAGYAARTKPSEGVRHPIYVKALAIEDPAGERAVLVTADLVGFPKEMTDWVAEEIRKQHGLARDRILFNASHNHSGPVTRKYLATRHTFQLDDARREAVTRYTSFAEKQMVAVAGKALADLAPASITFGQGFAGFAVNRRRETMSRALPGPVDHDVPVLTVQRPDGKVRAIVAGYACHATVLGDYEINGDWPGYAQSALEREFPGAVALFVQGAGADSNPLPRRSVELAQKYGEVLASAASQVANGKRTKPVEGRLRTAFELIDLPFQTPPSRQELERRRTSGASEIERRHAANLLSILDGGGTIRSSYPYPVQVWRLGDTFKLVALGGELVVDYSVRLKRQHGFDNTWIAGYSNDVMGYIASRRVLREGGYEGGGAMLYGSNPGPWDEAVEETIVTKVAELIERTAR